MPLFQNQSSRNTFHMKMNLIFLKAEHNFMWMVWHEVCVRWRDEAWWWWFGTKTRFHKEAKGNLTYSEPFHDPPCPFHRPSSYPPLPRIFSLNTLPTLLPLERKKTERRKNDNNELRLASCIERTNLPEMNHHWLSKSMIHSRCSLSPGDFYMIFWLHLKEKRHNQ